MAVVTDKFVFAHLPKTGGKFVRHVLDHFGIPCREVGDFHSAPGFVCRQNISLPVLVTIRHPVTWYQSRWLHRVRIGWSPIHQVDWDCASNDFNQFVTNVLDWDANGRFTSLVKLFVEKTRPKRPVDYIIKNENLTDEFYSFLIRMGYDIDRTLYYNLKKVNTSGKYTSSDIAIYKPEVLERLLEHEKWVIDEFYDGITDPKDLSYPLVV